MNTVHAVISEIRMDTHMIKSYLACSGKKDNIDELKNNDQIEFHGVFDTENDAKKFVETCTLNNTKNYTKMLHETGLPDKSKLLQLRSRYLLAYLDDDLTTVPSVYNIPIYEFMTLREHYPSIRLANDDEIEKTNTQNTTVPMTKETLNSIGHLQLVNLQVLLSKNPEDIQKAQKTYNEMYLNIMKLIVNIQNDQTEDIYQLMQFIMPKQDAEAIEKVKSTLSEMIQHVKTKKEEGMSDKEIEQELLKEFRLPNLVYYTEDEVLY